MKAHNVATVLFFVVLIALGWVFTVWTHSIHVPEEGEEAAVEGEHGSGEESERAESGDETSSAAAAGAVSGAESTGSDSEAESGTDTDASESATETTAGSTESQAEGEAEPGTAQADTQSPAEEAESSSGEAEMAGRSERVTLALARGDEATEGAVSLTLFAGAEPLDVGNWRLSDSLGEAGDAGHVLYFDADRRLAPGAPLTVVSSCGRDRAATLYWCLTHPESLWDAAEGTFYLRDDRGELALACDPTQREAERVLFECVR